MAGIAGSVAPVFRGEYSANKTYDFYHSVTYGNKLYFCKQDGTVEQTPSGATDDYWFMSIDGTFADAESLGGETAEQWQTKLDNIQTTSRATLSTAGWYRVVEYNALSTAQANGGYANSCEISIKEQSYGSVKIRLDSHANAQEFVLLSADYNMRIPKIRYTVTTDYKAYIEIYLSGATSIIYSVVEPQDYAHTWKTISAVATSETVDGVTVTTTYDIPANASPVTDLDLVEHALPSYTVSSDTAFYDLLNNYSANMGGNVEYQLAVYIGYSGGELRGGTWKIYGFRNDNGYETQIAVNHMANSLNILGRSKTGGTWYKFVQFATTADLANYFKNTGGVISGDIRIRYADNGYALLLKNNSVTADYGTEIKDYTSNGAVMRLRLCAQDKRFDVVDTDGKAHNILHSGNVGSYALPITGGTVESASSTPVGIKNTSADNVFLQCVGKNGLLGHLGFIGQNKPTYSPADTSAFYDLHHDGNSAKVAIQESAPTDTTALWVDTANKVTKAYIDGAWTQVA